MIYNCAVRVGSETPLYPRNGTEPLVRYHSEYVCRSVAGGFKALYVCAMVSARGMTNVHSVSSLRILQTCRMNVCQAHQIPNTLLDILAKSSKTADSRVLSTGGGPTSCIRCFRD